MKKEFGVLPKWKKPTIKPDYYIDDFSNNYGQAEPADIDGKLRTRLPVDSTPASAVCCGGGYACCRWCPNICDDLERSMEILPKLWWSVCHNFDEWQTASVMTKQTSSGSFPSAAIPPNVEGR